MLCILTAVRVKLVCQDLNAAIVGTGTPHVFPINKFSAPTSESVLWWTSPTGIPRYGEADFDVHSYLMDIRVILTAQLL